MQGSEIQAPEPKAEASRASVNASNLRALKWVFALEYMMQGLSNPFQGITYQPFFKHLRFHYGLSEAATQSLFAQSYLAWSFKPLLGFFIDAYGRTRTLMIGLLLAASLGYVLTPLLDVGPTAFIWSMFILSVCLAGTDVTVDRATVLDGAATAEGTGRPKSTTVGLNQAICWLSIYGTSVLALGIGGYVAEHVEFNTLIVSLALVPLVVLLAVWRLPKDTAKTTSVKYSVLQFWQGINTGPVLVVMLFFFTFKFQPSMGPLWTNYLIEQHKFTQSQVGIADAAQTLGSFVGVVLFARLGIRWQERLGMQKLFKIYVAAMAVVSLTQFLQVDPLFSLGGHYAQRLLPFLAPEGAKLVYLCVYSALQMTASTLVDMSTFSLVGSVVPTGAAGSLFAGFMSVANLGYSFSYASGAWLYDNGLKLEPLRAVQSALFGPTTAEGHLAIEMLILINALTYLGSYALVKTLPDRQATLETEGTEMSHAGPERWLPLSLQLRRGLDWTSFIVGTLMFCALVFGLSTNAISSLIVAFFAATLLRKTALDACLRRMHSSL